MTGSIQGSNNNDTINGTNKGDRINGRNGDDFIDGRGGNDVIDGGDGNDTISGGDGADLILGGKGNDRITGGTGNDIIYGGHGTDTAVFAGNFSAYTITSSLFDSLIVRGQDGTDLVLDVEFLEFDDGQYNVDTGVFTPDQPPAPAVVSLTPATVTAEEGGALTFTFTRTGGDLSQALTINYIVNDGGPLGGATRADGDFSYLSGIQQITFAAGQTTATITVQSNEDSTVEGDESFQVLISGGLDYTVDPINNGSAGVIQNDDVEPDTIDYSWTTQGVVVDLDLNTATGADIPGGSETLAASIVNVIGGSGNDTFRGDGANNALTGGAGIDTADYSTTTLGIAVNLGTGTATGAEIGNDTLSAIENVNGGSGNDTIDGDSAANRLSGNGGVDTLNGGDGDDFLGGGAGNDILDGGAGSDTVGYGMAGGFVSADLAAQFVTVGSGPGMETDTVINVENVNGSAFNDTLRGDAGNNTLNGNDGNDVLVGRLGDDTLNGGNGIDIASYLNNHSDYTFGLQSPGVQFVSGPAGFDLTTSVELLQFNGGT
jgi:Ca2+-binding RTX toxin-like protein